MEATEFGEYLRGLRKERGLTLEALGEAVGLTKQHLSNLENGRRGVPAPEMLKKMAEPLNISYGELMEKVGYVDPHEIISEVDIVEAWFEAKVQSNWAQDLMFVLENLTDENRDFLPYVKEQTETLLQQFLQDNFGPSFILTPKSLLAVCKKVDFNGGGDDQFNFAVMELLTILKSLADSTISGTQLEFIIAQRNVTYGGKILDTTDKQRILDMLKVLFPEE